VELWQTPVDFGTARSGIYGVVIARYVEPGEAVARVALSIDQRRDALAVPAATLAESMVLTLFLVPCLYVIVQNGVTRLSGWLLNEPPPSARAP
jgi:hypothetical protein